jgi:hypothetical protein
MLESESLVLLNHLEVVARRDKNLNSRVASACHLIDPNLLFAGDRSGATLTAGAAPSTLPLTRLRRWLVVLTDAPEWKTKCKPDG